MSVHNVTAHIERQRCETHSLASVIRIIDHYTLHILVEATVEATGIRRKKKKKGTTKKKIILDEKITSPHVDKVKVKAFQFWDETVN